MKKWLAAFLLALLGGFAAIAVLLYRGTELGPVTPFVESQLAGFLDRPVSLGAAPRLQVGKRIRIELTGAEVANAPWAEDTPLLQARFVSVELDTRSLFRGPVILHTANAEGLVLALERRDDGTSNLPEFGDAEADDVPWETLPVVVETALLTDITVSRINHETGKRANLRIERLSHDSMAGGGLTLDGAGVFQDRPWSLRANATDLQSIARTSPFTVELEGRLPRLRIAGSAQVPRLDTLRDLSLDLQAEGELPPQIADLTPLLKPDAPLSVQLRAEDIDPGVQVDATIQLPNLYLRASGEILEPLSGDGVSLQISANSPSWLAITRALSLADTEDVPVELQGEITRDGAFVNARGLRLQFGEHRIEADMYVPDFPRTDGARVDLRGQGPDFALYQRLLERPISFQQPYEFSGSLRPDNAGVEIVSSALRIGDHALSIGGPIGDFPSYRDSDVRFSAEGPDVDAISEALGVSLPHFTYRASGNVKVSAEGEIALAGIQVDIGALRFAAEGRLNGYPDFDNLDLNLQAATDSLAQLAREIELERLPGDVAARASLHLGGNPGALRGTDIRLTAGDLTVTTNAGGLGYADGKISSDIEVRVEATNLPALLGEYSHEQVPVGALSGTLRPRLDGDMIDLALSDFDGPMARGTARLRIGRSFQLDERTVVSVDMRVDQPGALLPDTAAYSAPRSPIQLTASTRRRGGEALLEAELRATAGARLALSAAVPVGGGARRLDISGGGDDLRALGTHAAMPEMPLPFGLDGSIVLDGDTLALDLRQLDVAGTRMLGTGSLDRAARRLEADLRIPQGALEPWIKRDARPKDTQDETEESDDGFLLPNLPLPLGWLDGYSTDLRLETGPLGISDPLAPTESFIDRIEVTVRSGDGEADVDLLDYQSSRGDMKARVDIHREGAAARIETNIEIRNTPGGLRMSEGDTEKLPRYALDAELSATGATTRELAATLTGSLLLTGGAGTLRDVNLGFATESFVDQLLTTLLPMVEKDSDLQVVCTVLGAQVSNGLVQLDPGFVLRSKSVDLTARGSVNLANEKIRIRFDNQARKGLGISAAGLVNPYVQITGTLARPALALDVASGAIAGGAAAATGGLSVVATTFYGRFLRRNPCKTAMERWEKREE